MNPPWMVKTCKACKTVMQMSVPDLVSDCAQCGSTDLLIGHNEELKTEISGDSTVLSELTDVPGVDTSP